MPSDDPSNAGPGNAAQRRAEITALAGSVFGSAAEANYWLTTPLLLFDNQPPLAVAETGHGFRQVQRILYNIQYSLPL